MEKRRNRKSESFVFRDNKGNTVVLSGDLTYPQLLAMGVRAIRFSEPGTPLPDNWYIDTGAIILSPHHGGKA